MPKELKLSSSCALVEEHYTPRWHSEILKHRFDVEDEAARARDQNLRREGMKNTTVCQVGGGKRRLRMYV